MRFWNESRSVFPNSQTGYVWANATVGMINNSNSDLYKGYVYLKIGNQTGGFVTTTVHPKDSYSNISTNFRAGPFGPTGSISASIWAYADNNDVSVTGGTYLFALSNLNN